MLMEFSLPRCIHRRVLFPLSCGRREEAGCLETSPWQYLAPRYPGKQGMISGIGSGDAEVFVFLGSPSAGG